MHRHIALRPLSDEHHGALVLARAVRWACEGRRGSVAEARDRARRAWSAVLRPHFDAEERLLAPQAGELAQTLLTQHRDIGAALERADDAAELAAFGRALDEHVRWEERVLFPYLESRLSEEELALVGARLREDGRGKDVA